MILNYLNPQTNYTAQERIMNLIYLGAVRRDQLLFLLSGCLKHARVDQVLQELRRRGCLSTVYTSSRGEAIYFLTRRGLRQIGEDGAKTARHRLTYHVSVTEILCRCIDEFGVHGWEWHSRPDDSDTIPSVRVRAKDATLYLDIDDGLRLSRQLYTTCERYMRLFRDTTPARILFVAANEQRKKYLKNRIRVWSGEGVSFEVCGLDQVTDFLRHIPVTTG
ncbi:replication-relaxation family protein [Alicyclobacillus mengziensis]|uniref:Replication-relaxation family protein n=1 Tax=Alicyclobacillus mengziensis TaxID=2931921 RepID=A0A9X7W211_9BACL|nr:replication-relaxation family protein [Alicyclobacillus mengziensis]QSO49179.1 replication-relaxation family protein [Alicyclobacillus mengziensis]